MTKTTNDLIEIAAAGGGLYVPSTMTTKDLIEIAAAASKKGARVVVSNASRKTTMDLIEIGSAGKGCVLFDLRD